VGRRDDTKAAWPSGVGDVAQEFGWIGGAGLEFFWQSIEIAMAMVCMD